MFNSLANYVSFSIQVLSGHVVYDNQFEKLETSYYIMWESDLHFTTLWIITDVLIIQKISLFHRIFMYSPVLLNSCYHDLKGQNCWFFVSVRNNVSKCIFIIIKIHYNRSVFFFSFLALIENATWKKYQAINRLMSYQEP